jgi:hypothetical protein
MDFRMHGATIKIKNHLSTYSGCDQELGIHLFTINDLFWVSIALPDDYSYCLR